MFSPDGRYFATASFDGTARVWETATGRPAGPGCAHELCRDGRVQPGRDHPRRRRLRAGRTRQILGLADGKEVRPPLRHDDIVLNVSFSPDGRYLAVIKHYDWSKNPELLVWEVASGTAVFRVP